MTKHYIIHNFKVIFFSITFFLISQILFSQGRVTQYLANLNRIHKQGSLMFTSDPVPEIFLNKENKLLDLGTYFLPIDRVEASYTYQARLLPNKKYHGVEFSCLENNCIKSIEFGFISNITTFFKSRKYCYDFINALNELKKALD